MVARGATIHEIASIYGVGRNKTHEIVRHFCATKVGRKSETNARIYDSVAEDYLNGLGIKKIAKKYGHCIEWVYRTLASRDIHVSEILPPKTIKIQDDLKAGELTQSQIAKKHGVSRQWVLQVKKKMEEKK
ncbi:MAG: hypothetical protein IJW55_07440 [Clostridia bacterium]|nr:hypothetical protein [Clostridia bacterium]